MLGNLDNEVIFKKAFTDKFVLKCLVKDLFGVDFEADTVETEKRFEPKISSIDFKYDIFAQSKDRRVIVEIQRIDYDSNGCRYNFDRFLLYHNMAIAEMQRTSKEYKTNRIVLTVVFFTGTYVAKDLHGNAVAKDILIYNSNLFDLEGREYEVFGHKLIFLNHNYVEATTPQSYRDWLVLVRESIRSPQEPQVNLSNAGIRKVTEIVDFTRLTPEELTETKNRNAAESAKKLYQQEAAVQAQMEIAKNGILKGYSNELISDITGLPVAQIDQLRSKINSK